jgi:hypothetical protein
MPAIGQGTDSRQERLDDARDELDHHCAYDDVLREKACIIEVLAVKTLDLVSISPCHRVWGDPYTREPQQKHD